jgi:hypothetical protein
MAWNVSSEDRSAQDITTQLPEQAASSDVNRFESWRAPTISHKIIDS